MRGCRECVGLSGVVGVVGLGLSFSLSATSSRFRMGVRTVGCSGASGIFRGFFVTTGSTHSFAVNFRYLTRFYVSSDGPVRREGTELL